LASRMAQPHLGRNRRAARPLPGGVVVAEGGLVAQRDPSGDAERTRRLATVDRRRRRRPAGRACLPSPARQLRPRLAAGRRQRYASLATGRAARRVVVDRRASCGPPQTEPHWNLEGAPDAAKPHEMRLLTSGRYWARTSDLRLVEAALSQLS
jgi:hypothetical protein